MAQEPSADRTEAFRDKARFRFLGLGLQDGIRYFFGGNAMVAILALVMISFFLAKEAFFFFPNHLEGLRAYRDTGQEYVGYIDAELIAHRKLTSQALQAYNVQIRAAAGQELALLESSQELKALLRERVAGTRSLLKKAEEKAGVMEFVGGEAYDLALQEVTELQAELTAEVNRAVQDLTRNDLERSDLKPSRAEFAKIQKAVATEVAGGTSPWLEALEAKIEAKEEAARERYASLGEVVTSLNTARIPLENLWSQLRDSTAENRAEVEKAATAPRRKEALESGAALANSPEQKAEMLAKAAAVDLSTPDPVAMTAGVREARSEHVRIRRDLRAETDRILKLVPPKLDDAAANELLRQIPEKEKSFQKSFRRLGDEAEEWDYQKPITMWHSVITFFLGQEWVTNSSWNDVYGLLPLLTGSTMIALIAIIIAVPFAVASAIYVNQIAKPLEQNLIKPTIEFIQAIPSIVLGFFGVVVLGDFLRDFSQIEALSWVPGFPMQERLNVLNAGLLLAFMSIPTIFTLAEDALNNVPKAYRDASLALGSTRLQTVFRVVVPTALSGIVAAVLLGFGRIIGETMVVLLVAGNKIAMPEFSEGLGVLTQPTHTMTGIIAQETGEVEQGSLHWRALFMVGMVLFTISLLLNSLSQGILKRYGNKG